MFYLPLPLTVSVLPDQLQGSQVEMIPLYLQTCEALLQAIIPGSYKQYHMYSTLMLYSFPGSLPQYSYTMEGKEGRKAAHSRRDKKKISPNWKLV